MTSLYRYQVTFPFTHEATDMPLHELRAEAQQRWRANAKHRGFKQDGPIDTYHSPKRRTITATADVIVPGGTTAIDKPLLRKEGDEAPC